MDTITVAVQGGPRTRVEGTKAKPTGGIDRFYDKEFMDRYFKKLKIER